MDLDAALIRLKKLEEDIAKLDPTVAEKLAVMLADVSPLLTQLSDYATGFEFFSEKLEELSTKLVSYAGDLNERVAALELAQNGQTTAPREAPPVDEIQPAPPADVLEQPGT